MQVDNRLCEMGRFGQKSGAGYYRYAPGSRQAEHDTEVDALVLRVAETLGYPRRDFADEEILERCLLALVNEGAKILDEGIAARSADIDTVYLNGYGFPAAEGGPMAWADRLGAAELLQRLRFLEQRHGARWKPASLVERLAAEGGAFADCRRRAEMDYQAPLRDMRFVLHELFDVGAHCELLGNGIDRELIDGVLEEGARYTGQVVAPLNRNSDEEGAKLKDGVVSTPTGFREAYRQYSENGWASMTGPTEYGGQGFPQMVSACFHEMLMAASLSFRVYSGLTEGAVLALYKHGDEALRRDYLGKLVSGEWAGTMCLTEPQAGTDLALLRTRAEAQADGSYAISGSKIFISGGEQDLTENIVHLVLARLADARPG